MRSCLVIEEFRTKLKFSPIGIAQLFCAAKTHYLVCKPLTVCLDILDGEEMHTMSLPR